MYNRCYAYTLKMVDFEIALFGAFKDYFAVATGLSYVDEIEICLEKMDHYYVTRENNLDSRPISDLQKVEGQMMNSREHYYFNWDYTLMVLLLTIQLIGS